MVAPTRDWDAMRMVVRLPLASRAFSMAEPHLVFRMRASAERVERMKSLSPRARSPREKEVSANESEAAQGAERAEAPNAASSAVAARRRARPIPV
jgi:hypothetical protein